MLLDFNSVGIERVIPVVEIKNKHLLNLYNNRGRVYKPLFSPLVSKPDFNKNQSTPKAKKREASIDTSKS